MPPSHTSEALKRPHPRSSQSLSQNRQPPLHNPPYFLKLHSPHLFAHRRSKPSLFKAHSARSPLSTLTATQNSPDRSFTVSTRTEMPDVEGQDPAIVGSDVEYAEVDSSDAGLPSQEQSIITLLSDADGSSGSDSSASLHMTICRALGLSVSKAIHERLAFLDNKPPSSEPLSPFEEGLAEAFSKISGTIAEVRVFIPPDIVNCLKTLADRKKHADAGDLKKVTRFFLGIHDNLTEEVTDYIHSLILKAIRVPPPSIRAPPSSVRRGRIRTRTPQNSGSDMAITQTFGGSFSTNPGPATDTRIIPRDTHRNPTSSPHSSDLDGISSDPHLADRSDRASISSTASDPQPSVSLPNATRPTNAPRVLETRVAWLQEERMEWKGDKKKLEAQLMEERKKREDAAEKFEAQLMEERKKREDAAEKFEAQLMEERKKREDAAEKFEAQLMEERKKREDDREKFEGQLMEERKKRENDGETFEARFKEERQEWKDERKSLLALFKDDGLVSVPTRQRRSGPTRSASAAVDPKVDEGNASGPTVRSQMTMGRSRSRTAAN
ncbi:hypothetical protein HGRIS_005417 [Hohenbuehelia grisea]|uniref:Uncharacterized protein n=1 Tax=Hohenbuehelia grisea TaxID=104357 RepID=A0ABR3JF05_9AGAR